MGRMADTEAETDATEMAGEAPDLGLLAGLVGYALRRAQLAVFADFHRSFAPLELRPAHFSVLLMLRQTPGLRQSQVADALAIKRTNFVALFDGLVARGLARRVPVDTDRRAVSLHLTPEGEAFTTRMIAICAEHESHVTARLGAEGRAQLLALLQKLVDL